MALQGFAAGRIIDHQVMTHANLAAVNTAADPNAVAPRQGSGARVAEGRLTVSLAPYSYQMIRAQV